MLCRVRIENRLMSHQENVMVGKEIGKLCKAYSSKKLNASDYVKIAELRGRLADDKLGVLSECTNESMVDAIKLMPLYMAAYLLYLSTMD